MTFVSHGLELVCHTLAYRHAEMCDIYNGIIAEMDKEVVIAAREMLSSTRRKTKTLFDVIADVRVIQYLIGYNREELCSLFELCLPSLRQAFPKCPAVISSNGYSTLLLKLFCVLWRCRTATPFRSLQALTGTSAGQLCEEFIIIQNILISEMKKVHPPSTLLELRQMACLFSKSFIFLNNHRFKLCCFFDNFYILIPRPGDDGLQNSLYSGYKGAHFVKGLLVSKSTGMGTLEVRLMYPGVADVCSTVGSKI